MPVLGSDISIDLHIIGDVELDTIRGLVQENGRIRPQLAGDLQRAIEDTVRDVLDDTDISEYSLAVDLGLGDEKVPGAPRQRIDAQLDLEGAQSVLASVDDAVGAPERARIADAAEDRLKGYLDERDLADVVGATVIVTPVEFR
ncbi:MAG: hypothetical protein ABEK84_05285 [Salinibacter sp.]